MLVLVPPCCCSPLGGLGARAVTLPLASDGRLQIAELDALVEAELKHGAVGARLTGAGFGGSTVALVEESKYEAFKVGVLQDYPKARFL